METPEHDVVDRLNAAVDEWNAQIGESHDRLAEQVSAAQKHLDALLAQADSEEDLPSAEDVARLEDSLAARDSRIASLEREVESLQQEAQQRLEAAEQAPPPDEGLAEEVALLRAELAQVREELARAQEEGGQPGAAEPGPVRARSEFDLTGLAVFDERGHKRRMGEILVEAGVITGEQLEEVLGAQSADPHQRFGALVVERGYTNKEVVGRILAAQLRLPFVDLGEESIDAQVAGMISASLAEQHCCVPIRREGDVLTVAMANPLDLIAIEDLELASNCRVSPVVATPAGIDFTITRYCVGR